MTPRSQRLALVLAGLVLAASAVGLTLYALRSNIDLFFTPGQIAAGEAPSQRRIRVGGLVEAGSVVREPQGLAVAFSVTDRAASLRVHYRGILPDLFREGQGVVVIGELAGDGGFDAARVLARHDETYMPPEVAAALAETGGPP
ncbi:cytochrome c maturation protein CcmE [Modicisalibacter radicis]|uniref:cytochrome c maturation protein CcmE n=1 Tax=Halomonas sp. EAR18 TaxID=2518972 RepID=UPI00109C6037|nr:cytochrome c maturation protein CcmE [Halomonas sp. EAR18]